MDCTNVVPNNEPYTCDVLDLTDGGFLVQLQCCPGPIANHHLHVTNRDRTDPQCPRTSCLGRHRGSRGAGSFTVITGQQLCACFIVSHGVGLARPNRDHLTLDCERPLCGYL